MDDNHTEDEISIEIPVYISHKQVRGAKIEQIEKVDDGSATLYLDVEGHTAMMPVSAEYMAKHTPVDGGYYVRYKDGYESFSTTEAFEGGNTLMSTLLATLPKALTHQVINELDGRRGFDAFWGDINEDIQEEIVEACSENIKLMLPFI